VGSPRDESEKGLEILEKLFRLLPLIEQVQSFSDDPQLLLSRMFASQRDRLDVKRLGDGQDVEQLSFLELQYSAER